MWKINWNLRHQFSLIYFAPQISFRVTQMYRRNLDRKNRGQVDLTLLTRLAGFDNGHSLLLSFSEFVTNTGRCKVLWLDGRTDFIPTSHLTSRRSYNGDDGMLTANMNHGQCQRRTQCSERVNKCFMRDMKTNGHILHLFQNCVFHVF